MKTSLLSWTMGLVAVSALVACGDDTSTTGAGGEGGGGTGGATTAVTTTTGGPTTTGGDGGAGTGGNTTSQGGSTPDCTEITAEDLENGSQQGLGFLFAPVAPNLGGDLADQAQIEFYDDGGKTFDGATPGTFDLADEDNYATCSRCVRVLEDLPEAEGEIGRQYFQASGTLELAEAGNIITAGFGTVTLTDVTLIEVEIDEEFNSVPVAGGACLHIASLEYDNPKIVPEEWTCDPVFYEAGDGCDCDCGAYDPDCDVPASVFGCTPELPYCDATGACGEVPTWWTCEDAEINDGATCNCDCGGPDPDCDISPDLPVDGCDAGQTCASDGITCLDPEADCNDFLDNDEDGSMDCADATTCQNTAACATGITPQDGDCETNNDCLAIPDPLCITNEGFGTAASFCSQWCNLEADDCGVGLVCIGLTGLDEGLCLSSCVTDDDCATGFGCAEANEGVFGCLPLPPEEWTCDAGFYGAGDGCDCGCGAVDLDCADATDASCEFCSADSCGNDGSEDGCDLALVDNDNNAVCN